MKARRIIDEAENSIRIVVFQGSSRSSETCPGQDGKTKKLMEHAISKLPGHVTVDVVDLAVKGDGNIIQPCKACISTAGGFHCHWPCSCYGPDSGGSKLPDYMHDAKIYDKLERCDGFAVFVPVNWYGPSTPVKAMFDRLVCANQTLTRNEADSLTNNDKKNADKTRSLAKSGKYNSMLQNHLEGKYAAFFVQGDAGANDYREYTSPRDESIKPYPDALKPWLDVEKEMNPAREIQPLVLQCAYSGIHVPKDCVQTVVAHRGEDYATGNDLTTKNKSDEMFDKATATLQNLVKHVSRER